MAQVYLGLLRGINVGGKNKVPMAQLKDCLVELGCQNVQTYIASGNVVFTSDKSATTLTKDIEATLPKKFALDSELIKILILTRDQLRQVVSQAPKGFGSEPETYHTDVIFLMGIDKNEAFGIFKPREGVDKVWRGELAVYSQRLSAERTKSRLSVIVASPLYKSMTIRTWSTTVKLMAIMDAIQP